MFFWPMTGLSGLYIFRQEIFACLFYVYSLELSLDFSFSFSLQKFGNIFVTIYEFFKGKFQLLTCKQVRFPGYRRKRRYSDVVRETNLRLALMDPIFRKRGKVLDLTTKENNSKDKCIFKFETEIEGLSPTRAEVDTDSEVNLMAEPYFLENKDKISWNFHPGPNATFGVIGAGRKSNYPPVDLVLQIGGVKVSGMFIISDELDSSSLLIGTPIYKKYNMGLGPDQNNDYYLTIGPEPLGSVPVEVVKKLTAKPNSGVCKKMSESSDAADLKVENSDLLGDETELEEMLEPGILVRKEKRDKSVKLEFIRKHEKIPENLKSSLLNCLEKIPELYSDEEFSKETFPKEIFQHDIELLDSAPLELSSKPFPCSGIRLQQLKEDIGELVRQGVLVPSDSNFVSPVFYVLKKKGDGKTAHKGRLCFDYRKLNSIIKPLNFPISNLKYFFDNCSNYDTFSSVDIKNAFLSIALTEKAQKLASIITPFGIFSPTRTPFGLKSLPSAFNFAMSLALGDLPWCQVYMDDLLICSKGKEEMAKHLTIVFERLAKFNLKIQLNKTKLFEPELKILGVIFSKTGRKIDPDKVKAISNFPEIRTLKQAQSFLGMVNFVALRGF